MTFCFLSYDILTDILLVFRIPFHQQQLVRQFHFRTRQTGKKGKKFKKRLDSLQIKQFTNMKHD